MNDINLIGTCGRYGAGKTTLTEIITNNSPNINDLSMINVNNRMNYIICMIFGFDMYDIENIIQLKTRDPIWNLSFIEAHECLTNIFDKYIDTKLSHELCQFGDYKVPHPHPNSDINNNNKWIELSLAKVLKQISCVIFNYDYEILLGVTSNARTQRETIKTKKFDICGKLTGRQCLEFFGTNIMREYFDNDIWIKILRRNINKNILNGYRIVISDIRFPNEKQMIYDSDKLIKGKLIVIYRKDSDLILTEDDKLLHPAGWTFLTFIDSNDIYIKNDQSINNLKDKIFKLNILN